MACSRAWAGVLASAVRVVSTTELVGVHAKEGGKRAFGFVARRGQTRRRWRWKRRANAGDWGRRKSVFYIFQTSPDKFISIFCLISSLHRSIG